MADNATKANQRKHQKKNQKNNKRRKRMIWTRDKHQTFVKALKTVGLDAGPKKILNAMDMAGITVPHVSSHLQKFRLYGMKKLEQEMKEKKKAAQRASSSKSTMQGAASSASPLYQNHTFGRYENASLPAWTMGNWPPKYSTPTPIPTPTPYVSVLPSLNQFASEQNNQMMFVRSAYPQSNFVERPVVLGRSSMNNNSNREANMEALLKNPVVPLIDLTGDSDCEQEQNSGANLTPQVMNFNSVPNYSWPNNPSGAMYTPISGDGLWGLPSNVATNEEIYVQEVAVQNPNNAAVFVNPLNVPNKMSIGSSEQNIFYADAVEGSNNNTVMPSVGDLFLGSEDGLAMIDEFFDDEVNGFFNDDPVVIGSAESAILIDEFFEDEVNGFFNDDPVVIGSAESALFSNENGTGLEISDGGMNNKPEEDMGSSSNDNVKLDIGLESLLMEHGMTVSPEWNYFLELGMPCYSQEVNNAQNSSAEETEFDVADFFCD